MYIHILCTLLLPFPQGSETLTFSMIHSLQETWQDDMNRNSLVKIKHTQPSKVVLQFSSMPIFFIRYYNMYSVFIRMKRYICMHKENIYLDNILMRFRMTLK